ncbi:MAG: hypothetical protein KDA85_18830, partial [Planctomycetaceae bacterium]|nr:hypothetical protein [Planctomycetaceae bacterium]
MPLLKQICGCLLLCLVAFGCDAPDEETARKAGTVVGESLTEFASGVGAGVERELEVEAELSPSMIDAGFEVTVSRSKGLSGGITLYLLSAKAYHGKLRARALAEDGKEIGRASADVDFAADDAKYVEFLFPAA